MHDNELMKQRKMERQYLKITMESLQYVGRQGIPLRGKEEVTKILLSYYYYMEKIILLLLKG